MSPPADPSPSDNRETPRRVFSTPARLAGVAVLALTLGGLGWVLTSKSMDALARPLAACGVLFAGVIVIAIGASALRTRK